MAYANNSNPNVQHSRMDNGTYKYYSKRSTDGTYVNGRRKASLPKAPDSANKIMVNTNKKKKMVAPISKPLKKSNMVTPISSPLKKTGTVNRKNARTGFSKTASAVYRKVEK